MKIRFKILSGFFILVTMLIIAGAISIMEFTRLTDSVRSLLDDNYKTIDASMKMLEALEREDSSKRADGSESGQHVQRSFNN